MAIAPSMGHGESFLLLRRIRYQSREDFGRGLRKRARGTASFEAIGQCLEFDARHSRRSLQDQGMEFLYRRALFIVQHISPYSFLNGGSKHVVVSETYLKAIFFEVVSYRKPTPL